VSSGDEQTRLSSAALHRLIEVGSDVVAELDPEAVLQRVLEAARELTGAQYAALGVLDTNRQELERFLTSGLDEATHRAIGDLPRGRGVLGVLIDDPRPLRLPDVGSHPQSYGFPAGHPPMSSFLGVPVVVRGEVWGNLYLTEKEDGEFDEADEEAIVVLARWAATAVENARLYRKERAQRTELQRVVRALEATTAITQAVGAETDIDRVLELIVKRSRALVEASSVVLMLADGEDLVVRAAAGAVDAGVVGYRYAAADSVGGHVLASGRPERLADVPSRVHFKLGERIQADSGLFVPLVFRSRRVGVLAAFDRRGTDHEFDAEDERLMTAFAASAATAVATAQDVAAHTIQRAIAASEGERSRWARELHDQTLQDLGGLKVMLSSARRTGDLEAVRTRLGTALEHVDGAIAQLRHLITELRPAALDELGAQPALEALAERVSVVSGLQVDMTVALEGGSQRLTSEVETVIYRFVQEALTNVTKHAGARRVEATVVQSEAEVSITVIDDGSGFEPGAQEGGFGLVGMAERIALVNGTLTVESQPGSGTTVHGRIPAAPVEDALLRRAAV
jgi:signal transduction histidine kinase